MEGTTGGTFALAGSLVDWIRSVHCGDSVDAVGEVEVGGGQSVADIVGGPRIGE